MTRMRRMFEVLLLLLLPAAPVHATPIAPCPAATLASYLSLPEGACAIGDYVLSGLSSNSPNPVLVSLIPLLGASVGLEVTERRDHMQEQQIEILSFTFGTSSSATIPVGSGSGAGKVDIGGLSYTMKVDKADPKIYDYCATGTGVSPTLCGPLPSGSNFIFPVPVPIITFSLTTEFIPDSGGLFGTGTYDINFVPVPEPSTLLFAASATGIMLCVMKIKRGRSGGR
jgi:hypothetical protein